MSSPSLEAIRLSKRFGGLSTLSNLILMAEGSKGVVFLGPNGAGKTTTLRIFAGLIFQTSGRALINWCGTPALPKKQFTCPSCEYLE